MESFPLSRVLPLYHCSLACKSVGTIVSARGGFGGHVSFGKHQSFIPACNSTTVRGEMARLGRTEVRFPEKLKCQTFEWKTDLCRHHVDQPPPLMLPTIPVHYHCVLPVKLPEKFLGKKILLKVLNPRSVVPLVMCVPQNVCNERKISGVNVSLFPTFLLQPSRASQLLPLFSYNSSPSNLHSTW